MFKTVLRSPTLRRFKDDVSSRSLKPFESIPGPRPLPLIGNIWRYLPLIGNYKPNTLFENAEYNKRRYGPIVREQLTKDHCILHLFDPNDVEALFRQDGKYPHRRSHRALLKYRTDRPHLFKDGGLFPENGPNWYRQRRQFQPRLMSKSHVSSNIGKLERVSLRLVESIEQHLSDKKCTNIDRFDSLLYLWALESSISVFLDLKIDKIEPNLIQNLTQAIHDSLIATDKTEIQTDKWIKNPSRCPHYQMLVKSQEVLYEFVCNAMDQFTLSDERRTETSPSFLEGWLMIDKLDKTDIISFMIDVLMAGLHATTYTASFLLYHLSYDRDTTEKLRQEVDCIAPNGKKLLIEDIDKMSVLRNCLKEAMRLNPVSIGTGRLTSSEGLILRGYHIPSNIMVITQNQSISREDSIFEDAGKFRPQRWSEYRTCARDKRPSPFASLPFGFGARSCIGQRLAELQIKVLVIKLLSRYNITFNHPISIKTTLIHNIDGPIDVDVERIG